MSTFYITDTHMSVQGEYPNLKACEQAFRDGNLKAGDYLVVQVVREVTVEPVPETFRVKMAATRTRSSRPSSAGKKGRKRKAENGSETIGATEASGL